MGGGIFIEYIFFHTFAPPYQDNSIADTNYAFE